MPLTGCLVLKSFFFFILWLAPTFLLGQEEGGDQRSSSSAYGQEELLDRISRLRNQETQKDAYEAVVSLFFDDKHVAEILARISPDEAPPRFRYRDIRRLTKSKIKAEDLIALGEQQDFQGWVELEILSDYTPVFDPDTLILSFKTPPEEKGESTIDYRRTWQVDESLAIEPELSSAYVNFFNLITEDDLGYQYGLTMEGAARLDPWVFEGRAELTPESEETFKWDNVRCIRDFHKYLTRLVIGETQSFRPRILSSDRLQGVKYSTEFDLQPRLVTEPISEYSFLLQRDSTVEIWINDQRRDSLRLAAGPYDILNFPLSLGLNHIVLKIIDDLGRIQTIAFDTIKGPNLLAPGVHQYAGSLGVRGRGTEWGKEPILSGQYRRGLSEVFTVSGEARWDPRHQGVGAGLDFATRWFFGSCDLGLTQTTYGFGYGFLFTAARNFKAVSASARYDLRSSKFLVQEQDPSNTRLKSVAEINLTAPRVWKLGSLQANAIDIHRWLGDREQREELIWNYTFNSHWSFRFSVQHERAKEEPWEYRAQLSFMHVGNSFRLRSDGQVTRTSRSLRSTVMGDPSHRFGDWSVTHDLTMDQQGEANNNVRGTMRYRHDRFNALYTAEIGDFGDENNFRQSLALNTSLAYTDGLWAVGQPIFNSFALILPEQDIPIVANVNGLDYYGDRDMAVVVPSLRPHYPAVIEIDTSHPSLLVDPQTLLVIPPHHGAYKIDFSSKGGDGGMNSLEGKLMDHDGSVLSYQAILIKRLEGAGSPIVSFTNQDGSFLANGLQNGAKYKIVVGYQDLEDPFQLAYSFTVPAETDNQDIVSLGRLKPTSKRRPEGAIRTIISRTRGLDEAASIGNSRALEEDLQLLDLAALPPLIADPEIFYDFPAEFIDGIGIVEKAPAPPAQGLIKRQANESMPEALGKRMQQLYDRIDEIHRLARQLKEMDAESEQFERLLEDFRYLRTKLLGVHREWQYASLAGKEDDNYILFQNKTTLRRLMEDMGSSEHLYICPIDIGDISLVLAADIPIPRAFWPDFLELIISISGLQSRTVNPHLRAVEKGGEIRPVLITDREEDLEIAFDDAAVCLVRPLPAWQSARARRLIQRFMSQGGVQSVMYENQLVLAGPQQDVLSWLRLYDGFLEVPAATHFEVIAVQEALQDPLKSLLELTLPDQDSLSIISLSQPSPSLVLVGDGATVTRAYQMAKELKTQLTQEENSSLFTFHPRFIPPQDLAPLLEKTYKQQTGETDVAFIVDEKSGVIISVVESRHASSMEKLAARLDMPRRQVRLDVVLMEITGSSASDFGIESLFLGDTATANLGHGVSWTDGLLQYLYSSQDNVNSLYRSLSSRRDIRIHSNPSITTLSGTTAEIAILQEISLDRGLRIRDDNTENLEQFIQRAQYGLTLQLTPEVHLATPEDGVDAFDYVTVVASVTFEDIQGTGDQPEVAMRQVTNSVSLRDGQTLILGSHLKQTTKQDQTDLPLFGEIPSVGRLFGLREELLENTTTYICITPYILQDTGQQMGREIEAWRPGDGPEWQKALREAEKIAEAKRARKDLNSLLRAR